MKVESTLSLKLTDLLSQVGLFLGYGRGADKGDPPWTSRQSALLQGFVDSGLRQFYFPPPVPPDTTPHDWSFLKPVATLAFPNATQHVTLPDDFGGFEGQVSLLAPTSASTQSCWAVPLVSIGMIHQRYAELPQASGRPMMCALSPNKGTTPTRGTRQDLWVFPTTDTNYMFQFQYYLLPDALTAQNPYYYGGMAHSDTVLESCLLIAESRLDDVPLEQCVHYSTFMGRLASSVHVDSRNKPQSLGYNRDRSDTRWRRWDRVWENWPGITVNGVQY